MTTVTGPAASHSLERVFIKNNFNADFIRRNIYWRNEPEPDTRYYSDYPLH